jgi:hypothetical protein
MSKRYAIKVLTIIPILVSALIVTVFSAGKLTLLLDVNVLSYDAVGDGEIIT